MPVQTASYFTHPTMETGHLYQHLPANLPHEIAETLAASPTVRIERIVSQGHCSPPGFWYEQEQNEWVLVVKGEARLRFEKDKVSVHLTEGMHIHIAAHERHRVEWTSEEMKTIWLAVFY